jgi:hypothetical protein
VALGKKLPKISEYFFAGDKVLNFRSRFTGTLQRMLGYGTAGRKEASAIEIFS